MIPALVFEPDGVALAGNQMMGRRAAGSAFLDTAVRAADGGSLTCYTASARSAETFGALVRAADDRVTPRWIRAPGLEELTGIGGLHLADPRLGRAARLRLRARADAWFLSAITHTLSSDSAIAMVADLLTGPVMPWDALICTSGAARSVVETVLQDQANYLAWRFGTRLQVQAPLLPVIPLGVHVDGFAADDARRSRARAALGIGADETAFLFAGRLSFHGKAHPFEMLTGLDAAARRTGRPLTLILAGQFFNEAIGDAYRTAAAQFAPGIRTVIVNGVDAASYAGTWAAADVFVSLSDNVQETFGITPVEAMAAGLPVVVTDWNGYRDTVRDGVDGFRIPTWAPAPGSAVDAAALLEVEAIGFDQQASRSSTAVSVDMAMLVDRLSALAADPALRARLGAAGRERARADYAWPVVFDRYRALWREQAAIRGRAASDGATAQRLAAAPREAAPYRDQTAIFAAYPTRHVEPGTTVSLVAGATSERFDTLAAHASLRHWNPGRDWVDQVLRLLGTGATTVEVLAGETRQAVAATIDAVARLAKLGLVRLG